MSEEHAYVQHKQNWMRESEQADPATPGNVVLRPKSLSKQYALDGDARSTLSTNNSSIHADKSPSHRNSIISSVEFSRTALGQEMAHAKNMVQDLRARINHQAAVSGDLSRLVASPASFDVSALSVDDSVNVSVEHREEDLAAMLHEQTMMLESQIGAARQAQAADVEHLHATLTAALEHSRVQNAHLRGSLDAMTAALADETALRLAAERERDAAVNMLGLVKKQAGMSAETTGLLARINEAEAECERMRDKLESVIGASLSGRGHVVEDPAIAKIREEVETLRKARADEYQTQLRQLEMDMEHTSLKLAHAQGVIDQQAVRIHQLERDKERATQNLLTVQQVSHSVHVMMAHEAESLPTGDSHTGHCISRIASTADGVYARGRTHCRRRP